jgi:ParB-like chromosome segregation protein Spo0J
MTRSLVTIVDTCSETARHVPHVPPRTARQQLPVSQLIPADSPRLEPEDPEHIRLLAGIEGALPPILVHRSTMRVIDGMHRLQAAIARGRTTIDVELFEGTEEEAFLEAVRRNIAHGKPLTGTEREAAAMRLLRSHYMLSDRALAEVCGLSPKTVGALRRRAPFDVPVADIRRGKDGKYRPVDSSTGRREAARLFRENPDATAREVARVAGIAQATAADVRNRIERGESPYPRRARPNGGVVRPAPLTTAGTGDRLELSVVAQDRALQSIEHGQQFVDWMSNRAIDPAEWSGFVDVIPISRAYIVARVARQCAGAWSEFADALEKRARQR